jgi:hypothetical protein
MNLPSNHIDRIRALGYTEAEARFLYIVAVHSGYFTLAQFRTFTGTSYGKRPTSFAHKLTTRGHAAVRDYLRRGSIFHLFSRTVYGQIDKDNLRNRRRHSFEFIRTRLVLLDFVLANQQHDYFETEQDKVSYFCEKLAVPRDTLPAKVYEGAPGSKPTIRYFVDKFPLFVAPPFPSASPVVTFSFVDSGSETVSDLRTHLAAYQALFRQLKTFRFLYIGPTHAFFRRAEECFRSLVQRPLESDISPDIVRYFGIRQKWDNHEYVFPVTEDFEFLVEGRQRFQGDRFETLYMAWRSGRISDRDLRAEFSRLSPDRTAFFETYVVHGHRSPLAVNGQEGDGCMKDTDHSIRHASRHPEGDAKLVRA